MGILSSTWTQSKGDDCALQPSERCPKNTALSCPPVSKIYPRGFFCYTAIGFSKPICCLQHISFPSLFHCAHCVCSALAAASQPKIKPSADKLAFKHDKKAQKIPETRDNQVFYSCLKWTQQIRHKHSQSHFPVILSTNNSWIKLIYIHLIIFFLSRS